MPSKKNPAAPAAARPTLQVVCMDMSKAFIQDAAKYLPQAAIAFDRFHVIQMANTAVDAVRREEARTQDWLKKTR